MKAKQRLSLGILLATFLAALDSTLMGTIGPTVANALKGMSVYPWLLTAFMASTTVATPVFGKLADGVSPKRLYNIGLGVFALGSLGCAVSPNMQLLILSRLAQGIGAGAMFTLGLVMIGKLFSGHDRARMQGMQSAMWGLAGVLGPGIGGVVAQFVSWRLLFFVNVPLALLVIWWIRSAPILDESEGSQYRIDFWGAGLLTIFLFCLLTVPTAFQQSLTSVVGWMLLVVGFGAMIAMYIFEWRVARHPLIPIRELQNPTIVACLGVGFLGSAIMFSSALLVPLLVHNSLGASQWLTGIVLLSLPLGWAAGSMVAGKLLHRNGPVKVSMIGIASLAAGLLGYQLQFRGTLVTGLSVIAVSGMLMGIGMGFLIMSALLTIQSRTSTDMGALTGLFNLVRNMGNAIGPALIGGFNFIVFSRQLHTAGVISQVVAGTQNAIVLGRSIHLTLWIPFGLALLLVPIVLRLAKGTPERASHRNTAQKERTIQ